MRKGSLNSTRSYSSFTPGASHHRPIHSCRPVTPAIWLTSRTAFSHRGMLTCRS